jgi:hypothetical protein
MPACCLPVNSAVILIWAKQLLREQALRGPQYRLTEPIIGHATPQVKLHIMH